MRVRGLGVESKAQIKPEVLEALGEVDTEHPSPHAGPPHAHEDAVSSLAGLALPRPAPILDYSIQYYATYFRMLVARSTFHTGATTC